MAVTTLRSAAQHANGADADLTRSIAALYGFHGVLLWIVSLDPERYRVFVWFAAVMNIAFGAMMLAIDLHAGMPPIWTAIEGPSIVAMGVAIAALATAAPRQVVRRSP